MDSLVNQKITSFLWFSREAEEAMQYYVRVFNESPYSSRSSRIISITRYEKGIETPQGPEMEGKVLTGVFELEGVRLMCLDGGDYFKFNEAISLYLNCRDQKEVDYFWSKLSHVPESEKCGWVKDKFGLSWQIIPERMMELLYDRDKEKSHRVANAMLQMKKINIKELERAYEELRV